MSYQISVGLESMSPSTYHYREGIIHYQKAGIIKTEEYKKTLARRSLDEFSGDKGLRKDSTGINGVVQEHLKKKRKLMRRKETQKLDKQKRLEILCSN